ncbi:biotin/lipoyl-binding carrier protein [Burkholderiaceae bacterium FT117]|uniref:biotin/lipoyl-binding carrier protein n=1 Tax=Zeimonas sediminis TaxID=2944268 RepID=UPI002342E6C6|nr:biotin/lipoyl-binding carrier protein [Zeimonas sediminis]MCM5569941.1 biotin/lipoyl-binding carrier protein [Zeimonas sediminis]
MASIKVRAEVTGSVWKLLKQPGDAIASGDEIMLIESMKMEIPVVADEDGTLSELLVAEGDPIQEGQVVATISA